MCEISNMPTLLRTVRCSSTMLVYWTGMSQPPNAIIFPPRWTCSHHGCIQRAHLPPCSLESGFHIRARPQPGARPPWRNLATCHLHFHSANVQLFVDHFCPLVSLVHRRGTRAGMGTVSTDSL